MPQDYYIGFQHTVEQRVNYKIALPVHKSLNEQGATQYLADNCQPTSARGLIES